ncbi:HEPN domain-containing protein [Desulfovibrio gilichinskyi]|uniref:HEPN domain-containing protein n=1 Tax=Desulfovibrio gilichinskyi TaxID=1519643 RepID=A0A1X7CV93_9BACT|nr:HEPN domain-containing protein [Desulfovibrio gilichinskyi]SMF03710.1 HEPN domain-containing protein [Desulfovibrio gilichinskyi]
MSDAINPRAKDSICDLARRSFRDVADQDYIAARVCYRLGLTGQFVWMAEQAVEKYLKAILLFNFKSAKTKHNLEEALKEVHCIKEIEFNIKNESETFIKYLNQQGVNRYFDKFHYTEGNELEQLDITVWDIRRYCQILNYGRIIDGKNVSYLKHNIAQIHEWGGRNDPHKFKIDNGYLEKVLLDGNISQRKGLIWNNSFYGSRRKSKIKIPFKAFFAWPTHVITPEFFSEYEKLVYFPSKVKEKYNKG